MSSRFPSGPGGSRYPRDRSPPRYDRHPSGESGYDRGDAYSGRGSISKEPPRGPKAQLGRGGFVPRARGFREDSFPRGRGRGQDWDARDRFEARDRRLSPPLRARSRSPYRESRDSDVSIRRGDSREGPPPSADVFPPRGRGGFRGRGRGEWEPGRARSYHPDERPFDLRSHSRERPRDQFPRDHGFAPSRRDEDGRYDREREREPYRPDSRNSYVVSRSTSTTPAQPSAQEFGPGPQGFRGTLDAPMRERRAGLDIRSEKGPAARESDRADTFHRRTEDSRHDSRASSPLPPPSVPAFGSIIPSKASVPEVSSKPTAPDEEVHIHPSRRALLEPSEKPHSPPSPRALKAPTAPKAQQKHGTEDAPRPPSFMDSAGARPKEVPSDPGTHWGQRFPQLNAPLAPRAPSQEQPSVRKALDEEGRNGNVASTSTPRPFVSDPSSQTSPMRIPTGPRAGPGGPPSIRNTMQPSIRGSMSSRGPTMMGRGGGPPRAQTTAWSWRNPALQPPVQKGPSIMNKVPTKRDIEAEEESKRYPVHAPQSAIEQWRQKHIPSDMESDKPDFKEREDQANEEVISKAGSQSPAKEVSDELAHESENEGSSDADIDMDLDDADFQKAQRNHERDLRRLEAKRPPSPRSDPELLRLLEELEAVALALKDAQHGVVPAPAIQRPPRRSDSQLPVKQDDEDEMDVKSERSSVDVEISSIPTTPPVESLPFLRESSFTPFSDLDEIKTPNESDDINNLINLTLQEDDHIKVSVEEEARENFAQQFRSWRREIELIDANIKEEHARETPTPPESTFDNNPAPQSVRSRRLVSDYSMEAIVRESIETAAREEQARREREERDAQVYVPTDTYNPDREATVPAMLDPAKVEESCFLDFNEQVEPHNVLAALRFLPLKDTFTKKEHNDFVYHYVAMPKKFGDIAKKLNDRSYIDCVRHYYATKRSANYKLQEHKFYKTQRGKKHRENHERTAGIRPRGGLLATFDGAVDVEAQNAALTESGRPRRAAAPTFGEATEGENLAPATALSTRRLTIGKENIPGSQGAERPVARRGKTATGQKPGRKPKGQPLLAAAPPPSQTPSPLKDIPQSTRPFATEVTSEPSRTDEAQEGAQLLANLSTSVPRVQYLGPSYTEQWMATQPMAGQAPYVNEAPPVQEPPAPGKPEPIQQPQVPSVSLPPQIKPQQASGTNSYWSVPEKTDFERYVRFFGTDWQQIASVLKTKTTQMIKNHFQRETDAKKGEAGKRLQLDAMEADKRRQRNEDMGVLPAPTPPTTKRRYESSTTREIQRPLAPVDLTGTDSNSSSVRRTKTRMSPPPIASSTTRVTNSSQAEQRAAASSAQLVAQGPQSPRGVIHMQQALQQRPPSAPSAQSHSSEAVAESARIGQPLRQVTEEQQRQEAEQRDTQNQHYLRAQQQQIEHNNQAEYQLRKQQELEHRRHLEHLEHLEQLQRQQRDAQHLEAIAEAHKRDQQLRLSQHFPAQSRQESRMSLAETAVPRVETDEQSRRLVAERAHRFDHLRQPLEASHNPPQPRGVPMMHQAAGRHTGSSQLNTTSAQSPATATFRAPPSSRMDPTRPSSVPAPPAPPAGPVIQPASQPKKSSIFSVLNSEPEEPKVPKRQQSDTLGRVSTPEASNSRPPLFGRAPPQRYGRPETPSQAAAQQIHSSSVGPQLQHRHPPEPVLLQERAISNINRNPSLSSHERALHQTRPSVSHQPFEERYTTASTARPVSVQLQRDRGPISPPAPHSRTSSYSSLNQHSAPIPKSEARAPINQSGSEPRLRPSPWTHIAPTQQQSGPQYPHPSTPQQPRVINPHQQTEVLREEPRRSLENFDPLQRHQMRPQVLEAPDVQIVDRNPRHFPHPHHPRSEIRHLDELQQRQRLEHEQELLRRNQMQVLEHERRRDMEMERRERGYYISREEPR